jgi:hypothetical protein
VALVVLRKVLAVAFAAGLLAGCADRDAAWSPRPLTNGNAPEDGCFYCPNDGVGFTFGTGYPGP